MPWDAFWLLFTHGAAKACVRSWHGRRRRANAGGTRKQMKREYDFLKAKRGPVTPVPKGKTRITIRLDEDVIAWFRTLVEGRWRQLPKPDQRCLTATYRARARTSRGDAAARRSRGDQASQLVIAAADQGAMVQCRKATIRPSATPAVVGHALACPQIIEMVSNFGHSVDYLD